MNGAQAILVRDKIAHSKTVTESEVNELTAYDLSVLRETVDSLTKRVWDMENKQERQPEIAIDYPKNFQI